MILKIILILVTFTKVILCLFIIEQDSFQNHTTIYYHIKIVLIQLQLYYRLNIVTESN